MKYNVKRTRHKYAEIYKYNDMYFIKENDNLYYEMTNPSINSYYHIGKGYKCFDKCIEQAIINKDNFFNYHVEFI